MIGGPRKPPEPCIYQDAALRLRSDLPLSSAEIVSITARLKAAYAFSRQISSWKPGPTPPGPVRMVGPFCNWTGISVLDLPLLVDLRSPAVFAVTAGLNAGQATKAAGLTVSTHRVVFDGTVVTASDLTHDDAMAHEAAHVQALRKGGFLPAYLEEGRARLIGYAYAASQGAPAKCLAEDAARLAALPPEAAAWAFANYLTDTYSDGEAAYAGQLVGALFVELLRTQIGGGRPDALARLAGMIEDQAAGTPVADAFLARFGLPLETAQQALEAHLLATADQPAARLAGTVFAQ